MSSILSDEWTGLLPALQWFVDRAGQSVTWSDIAAHRPRLAMKRKGIYKPAGSNMPALSVRQSLISPYPDLDPVHLSNGTWTYAYHQEGADDSLWTNKALFLAMERGMPVGVMRQERLRSPAVYRILGLARVALWRNGYFLLHGPAAMPDTLTDLYKPTALNHSLVEEVIDFEAGGALGGRRTRVALQPVREGQSAFRQLLLAAYDGACAVSGYEGSVALEASHISGYINRSSNHPQNGLLLRADFHRLFDAGLMAIDTGSMSVLLADELKETKYAKYRGRRLQLPAQASLRPSKAVLDLHRLTTAI